MALLAHVHYLLDAGILSVKSFHHSYTLYCKDLRMKSTSVIALHILRLRTQEIYPNDYRQDLPFGEMG
jgi:hypothetical protein